MFVRMVYPPTGGTGEADERAFKTVWSKKGWVLADTIEPEPDLPESPVDDFEFEWPTTSDTDAKVTDDEVVEPDDSV